MNSGSDFPTNPLNHRQLHNHLIQEGGPRVYHSFQLRCKWFKSGLCMYVYGRYNELVFREVFLTHVHLGVVNHWEIIWSDITNELVFVGLTPTNTTRGHPYPYAPL